MFSEVARLTRRVFVSAIRAWPARRTARSGAYTRMNERRDFAKAPCRTNWKQLAPRSRYSARRQRSPHSTQTPSQRSFGRSHRSATSKRNHVRLVRAPNKPEPISLRFRRRGVVLSVDTIVTPRSVRDPSTCAHEADNMPGAASRPCAGTHSGSGTASGGASVHSMAAGAG